MTQNIYLYIHHKISIQTNNLIAFNLFMFNIFSHYLSQNTNISSLQCITNISIISLCKYHMIPLMQNIIKILHLLSIKCNKYYHYHSNKYLYWLLALVLVFVGCWLRCWAYLLCSLHLLLHVHWSAVLSIEYEMVVFTASPLWLKNVVVNDNWLISMFRGCLDCLFGVCCGLLDWLVVAILTTQKRFFLKIWNSLHVTQGVADTHSL